MLVREKIKPWSTNYKMPLYCLKQASRQWNLKLTHTLTKHGFEKSKNDYSLFVKQESKWIVVCLVYVDGILISGNDHRLIQELKEILNKKF